MTGWMNKWDGKVIQKKKRSSWYERDKQCKKNNFLKNKKLLRRDSPNALPWCSYQASQRVHTDTGTLKVCLYLSLHSSIEVRDLKFNWPLHEACMKQDTNSISRYALLLLWSNHVMQHTLPSLHGIAVQVRNVTWFAVSFHLWWHAPWLSPTN